MSRHNLVSLALVMACAPAPPPRTRSVSIETQPAPPAAPPDPPDASPPDVDADVGDASPIVGVADASSPTPTNLEITLERTVCYGYCPAYKVTLRGDGTVLYNGDQFVKVHGKVIDHVAPADVQALAAQFDAAGFDKLYVPDPCYKGIATDNPTNRLTVIRGGKKRTVEHYLGNQCAPAQLSKLADAVDKTAGTDRWIRCGAGPRAYCNKP